jgi:hypothetical protein
LRAVYSVWGEELAQTFQEVLPKTVLLEREESAEWRCLKRLHGGMAVVG